MTGLPGILLANDEPVDLPHAGALPRGPARRSRADVNYWNFGLVSVAFLLGDDRPARLFCGAPAVGTSSWCEYHQRIVFPNLAPPKHRSQRQNPHDGQSGRGAANNTAVWRAARDGSGPSLDRSDDPSDIALEGAAGVA